MKKTISKKVYDTERSTLIRRRPYSHFGDPEGYEESLYQTSDGFYFLHVRGGESSKYPREDIKRMSQRSAEEWLANETDH